MDRASELQRLDRLAAPALAVVWGRRRVGKTRLLLEWMRRRKGIYLVADQSAEPIQLSYAAEAVAHHVPGFSDVVYPDWRSLLRALARAAQAGSVAGPVVIDELPYLLGSSPSLASVLQNFVDHEARGSGLLLVLAGSSQRMMQGLVLDPSAPLFGRARESFELRPLLPGYIGEALSLRHSIDCVQAYTAWGGIPWYWELAEPWGLDLRGALDALVLDPSGPLHHEPDRLLTDELPPATSLRALLDAIGAGAHRVSEIAARIGQPATSLARPIARLAELHLIERQQPHGEPERSGKRALYKIHDPFLRLWFRVVAPNRAALATSTPQTRRRLLDRLLPALLAEQWESLCRTAAPRMPKSATGHSWGASRRYWRGNGPEWDVVAEAQDDHAVLLGEAKWFDKPATEGMLRQTYEALLQKGVPALAGAERRSITHAVFVPHCPPRLKRARREFLVLDAEDVMGVLR